MFTAIESGIQDWRAHEGELVSVLMFKRWLKSEARRGYCQRAAGTDILKYRFAKQWTVVKKQTLRSHNIYKTACQPQRGKHGAGATVLIIQDTKVTAALQNWKGLVIADKPGMTRMSCLKGRRTGCILAQYLQGLLSSRAIWAVTQPSHASQPSLGTHSLAVLLSETEQLFPEPSWDVCKQQLIWSSLKPTKWVLLFPHFTEQETKVLRSSIMLQR